MAELSAADARPILRVFPTEVPTGVGFMKRADSSPREFEALAGRCAVLPGPDLSPEMRRLLLVSLLVSAACAGIAPAARAAAGCPPGGAPARPERDGRSPISTAAPARPRCGLDSYAKVTATSAGWSASPPRAGPTPTCGSHLRAQCRWPPWQLTPRTTAVTRSSSATAAARAVYLHRMPTAGRGGPRGRAVRVRSAELARPRHRRRL